MAAAPPTVTFRTALPSVGATVTATTEGLTIRKCKLYATHRSPVLERHHIAPQSWWKAAGVKVESPLIDICGLCHNNAHAALDALIRGISTDGLPVKTIDLARLGLVIAREQHLTPKPTL